VCHLLSTETAMEEVENTVEDFPEEEDEEVPGIG
jgi:hypothetical protein